MSSSFDLSDSNVDAVGGPHSDLCCDLHQDVDALFSLHTLGMLENCCWWSPTHETVKCHFSGVSAASSRPCGSLGGPVWPVCFNLLATAGPSQMGGAAARLTGNNTGQNPLKVRTKLKSQMRLMCESKIWIIYFLITLNIFLRWPWELIALLVIDWPDWSRHPRPVVLGTML